MEHIKVCRICLIMDVNMYDLHSYPLGTYYEPIIGKHPISMTDLPPFACYECATLIKKFYFFRERCLRGQAALYGILQSSGQISTDDIRKIDRQYFHLTSNITFNVQTKSEDFCYTYEEANESRIKTEPLEETDNIQEWDTDLDTIKTENNFEDITYSNNVPISTLNKSNEDKKIEKILVKEELGQSEVNLECNEDPLSDNTLKNSLNSIETTDVSKLLPPVITEVVKSTPTMGRPMIIVDATIQIKDQKPRTSGDKMIDAEKYANVIKLSSAGDLECSICNCRCKTKRELRSHINTHEQKYAHNACPYVTTTTGSQLQIIGDIKIEYDNDQTEVDAENPTTDHLQQPREITGVRLNDGPKTSAERGRAFRAQRALLRQQIKQQQLPSATVDTATGDIRSAGPGEDSQAPESAILTLMEKRAKSAEATRRWREKKRLINGYLKKQPKTVAQRMREYRERKKLQKPFECETCGKASAMSCINGNGSRLEHRNQLTH